MAKEKRFHQQAEGRWRQPRATLSLGTFLSTWLTGEHGQKPPCTDKKIFENASISDKKSYFQIALLPASAALNSQCGSQGIGRPRNERLGLPLGMAPQSHQELSQKILPLSVETYHLWKKQLSNKSHMNFRVGIAEGRSRPTQSGGVPIPGCVQETTGCSTSCYSLVNKVLIRQRLEVFSNQNDSVILW